MSSDRLMNQESSASPDLLEAGQDSEVSRSTDLMPPTQARYEITLRQVDSGEFIKSQSKSFHVWLDKSLVGAAMAGVDICKLDDALEDALTYIVNEDRFKETFAMLRGSVSSDIDLEI